MTLALEFLTWLCVAAIAGGVYLEFGPGWALIVGGVVLLALVLRAERLHAADASHETDG